MTRRTRPCTDRLDGTLARAAAVGEGSMDVQFVHEHVAALAAPVG
jgi:hypothetical protein